MPHAVVTITAAEGQIIQPDGSVTDCQADSYSSGGNAAVATVCVPCQAGLTTAGSVKQASCGEVLQPPSSMPAAMPARCCHKMTFGLGGQ
jgi:hypothetical protein